MGPEAERTPPVRRPERRDARGLGAAVVAIAVQVDVVYEVVNGLEYEEL